ncbi:MAG TPA: N-acetylmuramoyl-L-alanine amidase [Armatimonadota bacterium]|nr:N-acetylmuramoyl-L-alanine amidase [Armatimonadota bacterium]
MRPAFAASVAALLAALVAVPAAADRFVAGGEPMPSPAPFQVLADKEEVCAPAVAALRRLGVQITAADGRIDMRAPNGASLIVRTGSDQALVNGVERALPAAVSRQGEHLFLPLRTVAWHLGIAYRWDQQSRTIFLHPRVTDITFARLPDKVRVTIGGSAQLSYSAGTLKQPPRIYVDVANADLFAAEQQILVNEADLVSVRASQNSLNPDSVRVVLDLKQEVPAYHHSTTDGGRTIVIDLPAPKLEPETAQGTVTVDSIRLVRRSDTVCALVVNASGAPVASLSDRRGTPQTVVELSNARLTEERVEGEHPLVESATAEQTGENEARIVLNLRSPQPAALARGPRGLCVLLGQVPPGDVTVVLDPGHGGGQPGAPGRSGLEEKTVNLAVALRAEKLLRAQGARVLLTRREDCSLIPLPVPAPRDQLRRELTMRAGVANKQGADVFISIHCNAGSASARGTETYYSTPRSLGLAKVLQQELLKGLGRKDGGVRRRKDFVVTSRSLMPAALVELAFLSSAEEEALLGSPEFQQRAAQAITDGVRRFAEEGGLLAYYAELESVKWVQTGAAAARSQPTPAAADSPGSGASAGDSR